MALTSLTNSVESAYRYVVFDVETTGLSPGKGDRVIEIGAVAIEDNTIVEERRAGYGEALLKQLSADLASRFGRGFAKSNLYQTRTFYVTYQDIFQTAFGKSKSRKFQTPSGKSQPHNSQTPSAELTVQAISERFPLPWSAYVRLLSLKSKQARAFYEEEALRGGWSVRQLNRQIEAQFYERTALSKNKAAMLTRGAKPKPQDAVTLEKQIKDPYVCCAESQRLLEPRFMWGFTARSVGSREQLLKARLKWQQCLNWSLQRAEKNSASEFWEKPFVLAQFNFKFYNRF